MSPVWSAYQQPGANFIWLVISTLTMITMMTLLNNPRRLLACLSTIWKQPKDLTVSTSICSCWRVVVMLAQVIGINTVKWTVLSKVGVMTTHSFAIAPTKLLPGHHRLSIARQATKRGFRERIVLLWLLLFEIQASYTWIQWQLRRGSVYLHSTKRITNKCNG